MACKRNYSKSVPVVRLLDVMEVFPREGGGADLGTVPFWKCLPTFVGAEGTKDRRALTSQPV